VKYDHRYHAGNFADLIKHIVFQQVILYSQLKDTPTHIVDTHSGFGSYPLNELTYEAKQGILALPGRVWSCSLMIQYYKAIEPILAQGIFPGSPILAAILKRTGDSLWAFEKYEEPFSALENALIRFEKTYAKQDNGLSGLKSLRPPAYKRSIVLIDPPYERLEEYTELAQTLEYAAKKFLQGTYIIWYPHSKRVGIMSPIFEVAKKWGEKVLIVDYYRNNGDLEGLSGAGLLVLNPPFNLKDQLNAARDDLASLGFELVLS